MSDYKWKPTSSAVYWAIYNEHMTKLGVFGTISHSEDSPNGRRMYTEWGFRDSETPLIAIDSRGKEHSRDWSIEHYIFAGEIDSD